jgi:hypothetical protein
MRKTIRPPHRRIRKVVALFLLLILSGNSHSEEMQTPVDIQYPILLKIVALDKRFQKNNPKELAVAILYQGKFRSSLETALSLDHLIRTTGLKFKDVSPVRAILIDISNIADLREALLKQDPDVLYIAPVRALDLRHITSLSRELKWITFSGVPEYADIGVGLSIGIKASRPQIIVNLQAVKAEGSSYSSQLLGISKVIE